MLFLYKDSNRPGVLTLSLPVILYFDPYVSSEYILKYIDPKQYQVFALITPDTAYLAKTYNRLNSDLFSKVIYLTGHSDQDITLVSKLEQHHVIKDFIIGYEETLPYLESLTSNLFPERSNVAKNSGLRSDKYQMNQAMSDRHFNAVKQMRVNKNTSDTKVKYFLATLHYPVIVKPAIGGFCSRGVVKCGSETQAMLAIREGFKLARAFTKGKNIETLVI